MKRNKLTSKLKLSKETISNLNEIKGGKRPFTWKKCNTELAICAPSRINPCITQDAAC